MRKLKLQVQMTLDGYIAGQKGEMDFMVWNWDEELKNYIQAITDPIDCIVLGRKLAEGFIPYWHQVASDQNSPEQKAGLKFTDTSKVVFSKTLEKSVWDNTRLAKGNLTEEINQLKEQQGKDIIVYGGAAFVSSLIKQNLIDEFHLLVNPTIIGKGLPIFHDLHNRQDLDLIKATSFTCGIVALHYERKLNQSN